MKAGGSPVTEADIAVDDFLRTTLLAARPDYGWLSEETADDPARLDRPRVFVVDPIDGTRAFIEGGDVWCVSLAVVEEGRPVVAALNAPARNEVYTAARAAALGWARAAFRVGPAGTRRARASPGRAAGSGRRPCGESGAEPQAHIPSLAYRLAQVAARPH